MPKLLYEPGSALQIGFCSCCNNILLPTEDSKRHILLYKCRHCKTYQDAISPCVSQNRYSTEATERTVYKDLANDPTYPKTNAVECPKCQGNEAVYFQSKPRETADSKFKLYYSCVLCGHKWTG